MPLATCIVGGGPAGLATAIALGQRGLAATVIDHALPPIDKACGEGLLPQTLELLGKLGVQVPPQLGFRFSGIRFLNGRSSAVAHFRIGSGIGIRRTVLHSLLVERARSLGVTLRWGAGLPQAQYDYLIAADGQNSRTRQQAGFATPPVTQRRYGFRRHFRIEPWSPHVEVYWLTDCQIYVTPIAAGEVSVALLSRDPHLRLTTAIARFPELASRLSGAVPVTREAGGLSLSRRFPFVTRGSWALVGDASGSVDAITGEGLGLSFEQALALARAIESQDLGQYERAHAAASRRPRFLSSLLLTLDRRPNVQHMALAALARFPGVFSAFVNA